MIRSCRLFVVVAVLVLGGMRLDATIQPYFFKIDCANGFADAYVVVVVDTETGGPRSCFGVDCKGRHYRMNFTMRDVSGPPDLQGTYIIPATATNGTTFYLHVRVADGELKNVWGTNVLGRDYIGEAQLVD